MTRFLNQILDGIQVSDLPELRDYAYVFPTKRAGLFFEQAMRQKFSEETFWSPQIYSIQDFVETCCRSKASDELTLLFELYTVYQKYRKNLNFDQFYSWGQILLHDFDELDRYLVEADLLYRSLQDIKDIEVRFSDQEQMMEAYRQFARVITENPDSLLVSEFVKTWETVRKVYIDFKQSLSGKGLAYEGMLYRDLVQRLKDPEYSLPFNRVVFAGFNALSRSEERIFELLNERQVARFFWDADESYLEDRQQEAGYFLRLNRKKWPGREHTWVLHNWEGEAKEIQVIGVPQGVGQAKIAGLLLRKDLDPDKTAIVLADENLLFPVLYSLPEDLATINVSMGYPIGNSPLFSLVRDFVRLQAHKKGKGQNIHFRASDLLSILKNPFLKTLDDHNCNEMIAWISQGHMNWVGAQRLDSRIGNTGIKAFLQPVQQIHQALVNCINFLVKLHITLYGESGAGVVDQEIIYHFVKLLRQLDQRLSQFQIGSGFELLEKIIKETLQTAKVPFTGEPLTGLQILGFLETRVLDFENLIILSINEGKLPGSTIGKSYIPFALRRAFEMPTFREHDSIYAYHFFRLLQRTRRAFLVYDTEVEIDGSGEKSRFLLQLIDRYKDHSTISLTENLYVSPIPELNYKPPAIVIEKNAEILKILEKYLVDSENARVLGPTVLGNYIDCSLRFYFRFVARLDEPEAYTAEMDPREFGLVVHSILESIYEDHVSSTVDSNVIDKISRPENITAVLRQKLEERSLLHDDQLLEGRNLLNHRIIQSLVDQILALDRTHAPFKLLAVESKEHNATLDIGEGRQVNLGGTIDRIDEKTENDIPITRIIDYKTGKIDMLPPSKENNPDTGQYIDEYFSEGKYKAGLQGFYYGYLLNKSQPGRNIKIGVFGLQEINKGIQFLRNDSVIGDDSFREFERRLRNLLQEIWNPKVPFTQTEDINKCVFCPYATICSRN